MPEGHIGTHPDIQTGYMSHPWNRQAMTAMRTQLVDLNLLDNPEAYRHAPAETLQRILVF